MYPCLPTYQSYFDAVFRIWYPMITVSVLAWEAMMGIRRVNRTTTLMIEERKGEDDGN
jgi:hypothetical protein